MLKWGLVYFLLAVASGIVGFSDSDTGMAVLAQVLFFGNMVLFVVFTLLGAMTLRPFDVTRDTSRGNDS